MEVRRLKAGRLIGRYYGNSDEIRQGETAGECGVEWNFSVYFRDRNPLSITGVVLTP